MCSLHHSKIPSHGFSHTLQVKRCSLLQALTYGSTELYISSPVSLFPLSELFAPTRCKNGEQHGYFASYFVGVNRIRCFWKKALGKMGTSYWELDAVFCLIYHHSFTILSIYLISCTVITGATLSLASHYTC